MRFLADAGISPKTVEFLKHLGHDAAHVRDIGLQLLFRLKDETAASVNRGLARVLAEQSEALASGALILVEDGRYRIRKLPIRPAAG